MPSCVVVKCVDLNLVRLQLMKDLPSEHQLAECGGENLVPPTSTIPVTIHGNGIFTIHEWLFLMAKYGKCKGKYTIHGCYEIFQSCMMLIQFRPKTWGA